MTKFFLAALGGTAIAALSGSYYFWQNRKNTKAHLGKWEQERIRDAYYATLTQNDVAWG